MDSFRAAPEVTFDALTAPLAIWHGKLAAQWLKISGGGMRIGIAVQTSNHRLGLEAATVQHLVGHATVKHHRSPCHDSCTLVNVQPPRRRKPGTRYGRGRPKTTATPGYRTAPMDQRLTLHTWPQLRRSLLADWKLQPLQRLA